MAMTSLLLAVRSMLSGFLISDVCTQTIPHVVLAYLKATMLYIVHVYLLLPS
jgi:hypothetical protein